MIVCLGTTPALQRTMTFDHVNVGDVNRSTSVHQFASGKAINVARVARTLNEDVIVTGFIGGATGTMVRNDLDLTGIQHDFVDVAAPTRTCITLLDESSNSATELIENASACEPRDYEALLIKLSTLITSADAVVLTGSLPPGAPEDFYARCVHIARRANVISIVDATGNALLAALSEKPTLIKPNRTELASTAVDPARLIQRGAESVVISDGANLIHAFDGESHYTITPPTIKPINPIGSGDALCAGAAIGLVRKLSFSLAIALGVACGAANALTPHAGHINKADVDALLPRIDVFES